MILKSFYSKIFFPSRNLICISHKYHNMQAYKISNIKEGWNLNLEMES